MGSYLSEPVTEKVSSDETDNRLNCGASSMQGWRVSQEDAHNCLLDFDVNTSFFAVYDGHGGHEVAHYCSEKLPQFIKNTEAYKQGDINNALIEGFLGFDKTICTKEVVSKLKEIAGDKQAEEDSEDEDNVDNLYKEAAMPIEQVIEKYTSLVCPALDNVKKVEGKCSKSPYLKSKRGNDSNVGSTSSSSSVGASTECQKQEASGSDCVSSSNENEAKSADTSLEVKDEASKSVPDIKLSSPDSSDSKEAAVVTNSEQAPQNEETVSASMQNGQVTDSESKEDVTSSTPQENGEITKKGKGKAIAHPKTPKISERPKRNAKQLYKSLLDFAQCSEEDTEDEEDQTFEGPYDETIPGASSDDEDEGVNIAIEAEDSGDDASSELEEEEEEESGEEEEEDIEDEEDLEFARNMKEEPGSDSGCTAVVALLKGNELYVANAGDSRCIVCRNGNAIDMSFDHKPEDDPERDRIVKAGGKVTSDGRVNGGLNLSRAIGDHAYKQNKELSDREQMITALPDVKTLTVNPGEDEFMVLACDGIWNFMSSQEVVDFVRPMLGEREKLSVICEEMFDHCLAPNTMGDGTGCDNMTAIIVQFKSNILKRSASPELLEKDSKRAKTGENSRETGV
ncbi:unnamed protein product [Phaedon cochleariae]|uniref:protein-serine/threonine phosphatase n=1 Tax=Phaedon cochleariae TaxID=80249 RepID=A0A9P0DGR5_PHACE|nr:unnamed protein product [Phaedon cochleariae]